MNELCIRSDRARVECCCACAVGGGGGRPRPCRTCPCEQGAFRMFFVVVLLGAVVWLFVVGVMIY